MPIGTATAIALGGSALLGGIAGAAGKQSNETSGYNLNPASTLQNNAQAGIGADYQQYRQFIDSGPGQQDVSNAYGANRDLASMLDSYRQNGMYATQDDINRSNGYADSLFAPQQAGLNQQFELNRQQFANQAAIQGRNPLDAVFANKQYTAQSNAQLGLNAERGAFATNYAMQQPMQRLGLAEQRTNLLNGLATQAMANRQALMSMGSGLLGAERNYQLSSSERYGKSSSGGGLSGAIEGALGGLGAGSRIAAGFNSPSPSSLPSGLNGPMPSNPTGVNPAGYQGYQNAFKTNRPDQIGPW